jgi:hypothetical protein
MAIDAMFKIFPLNLEANFETQNFRNFGSEFQSCNLQLITFPKRYFASKSINKWLRYRQKKVEKVCLSPKSSIKISWFKFRAPKSKFAEKFLKFKVFYSLYLLSSSTLRYLVFYFYWRSVLITKSSAYQKKNINKNIVIPYYNHKGSRIQRKLISYASRHAQKILQEICQYPDYP